METAGAAAATVAWPPAGGAPSDTARPTDRKSCGENIYFLFYHGFCFCQTFL